MSGNAFNRFERAIGALRFSDKFITICLVSAILADFCVLLSAREIYIML